MSARHPFNERVRDYTMGDDPEQRRQVTRLQRPWWLFAQEQQIWGMLMIVWGMFIRTIDNFVKPWLIGFGVEMPMSLTPSDPRSHSGERCRVSDRRRITANSL